MFVKQYYNITPEEMQEILDETLDKILIRVNYKNSIINLFQEVFEKNVFQNFKDCGSFITVNKNKQIINANFCKNRFCPVCNKRYSSQKWAKVKFISERLIKEIKPTFALLTITVKNVNSEQLKNEISHVMKSIDRLHKTKLFKENVLGYFRSLEITYNKEKDTYHPHYHYILCLPKDYKEHQISTYQWRKTWERSARLDYTSQVNIKIINQENDLNGGIAEVAKYAVKISSVIQTGKKEPIKTIQEAIKNRRLISFGGIIKDYSKMFDKQTNEYKQNFDKEPAENYILQGEEYIKYS